MAFMDYLPQFGENVNQTSDDATLQQINLKRQLALADSLRNTPELQGQMVSGHYVAPSWTQSLANVANKYIGNKIAEKAMKDYGNVAEAQQAKKQQALVKLLSDLNPKPTEQTTMQPTQVDLQQGMNVPTSPFGTNEQVGMTSPYNTQNMAGQSTMMQPTTIQIPPQPLSKQDVLGAVTRYGQTIGDNKIGEGAILDYVKQMYSPKKATWVNAGGNLVQIDESGQPTGQTMPIGISANTQATLEQSGKQHEITNKFKKEELEIERKKLNPLNLPDLGASSKPLTNKKGWTLHTDANGNQAYVSPDGKNYEEAN